MHYPYFLFNWKDILNKNALLKMRISVKGIVKGENCYEFWIFVYRVAMDHYAYGSESYLDQK